MGSGVEFRCRCCGFELSVREGIGFLDFEVEEELKEKCIAGEFGEEVQQIVQQHPDCEIDSRLVLYRCITCGRFENVHRLNVCFTDDLWDKSNVKGQTRKRKGGVWVYYYQHRCSHCQGRLIQIDTSELTVCPQCGDKEHWRGALLCWD